MDPSRQHRDSLRAYRSRSRSRSEAIRDSQSPASEHRHHRRRHHHHHHHHRDRPTRSRSRSPERKSKSKSKSHSRREHGGSRSTATATTVPVILPLGARQLSKHDLPQFEPMFAMYLDIQKNIDIADLDEREVKGRWKSFVSRWNRGELAEGWYDPSTLERARGSYAYANDNDKVTEHPAPRASPEYDEYANARGSKSARAGGDTSPSRSPSATPQRHHAIPDHDHYEDEDEDEDEESYGPILPTTTATASTPITPNPSGPSGPTIPTTQDLQLRHEDHLSTLHSARLAAHKETHLARASHKAQLRSIEDEIAPRAEPGSRERRLEKRREAAAANRAFAERKGSGDEGVGDEELMGGGGGGGAGGGDDLAVLKREKEREARKKNEREIRREEMLRARAAEREERLKTYRRKEEETMSVLKALAKQRFG
ncbi:hypothetical protein FQN55_003595 [Onygenales sp. PD_40]|nr:hypothetical protein FQN55_003595 [Onygenales sp. PD_40]